MKRPLCFLTLAFILFFFWNSTVLASEPVDTEAAKRAAEYHGEMIFKKELKVCDHELMYWPWGEPAVYVFTLIRELDFYPQDILAGKTFLQGAYLVSIDKEIEGYTRMAQADRYLTVIVGATTDMPSFIKAHAGLPEHVLSLAVMGNPPLESHWIYGGLFHTFLGSRAERDLGESKVTEIHLGKKVALKDLGFEKVGTVPAYAEELEWGAFINPDVVKMSGGDPYLINITDVREGEHRLEVTESNIQGNWEGCSPAAFVNCLGYHEDQELIDLEERGINELLQWTAICYRTDSNGFTKVSWIRKGSEIMFKGLGYDSHVQTFKRTSGNSVVFLNQYADQINDDFPCNLSNGDGIFNAQSTAGIGYSRQGNQIQLIIHDGWNTTPDQPVYVKYSGYPAAEIEYPKFRVQFHPGGEHDFDIAVPQITAPKKVNYKKKQKRWKWEENLFSRNNVKVECYGYVKNFFDNLGHKYKHISEERKTPYFSGESKITLKKPPYKGGKAVYKYKLIDDNGHLLEVEYTIKLLGDISGIWRLEYTWEGFDTYEADWYVYGDGTFKDSYNETGKWSLKGKNAQLVYDAFPNSEYSGKLNKKYTKMEGKMKDSEDLEGTWKAVLKSTDPKKGKEHLLLKEVKPNGSPRDCDPS